MKCNKCGYNNVENAKFCSSCGAPIHDQNSDMEVTEDKILFFPTEEKNLEQQNTKQENIKQQNTNVKNKNFKMIAIIASCISLFLIVALVVKIGVFDNKDENKETAVRYVESDSKDKEENNTESKDTTENSSTQNSNTSTKEIQQQNSNTSTRETEQQSSNNSQMEIKPQVLNIVNTQCTSILHDSFKNDYASYQVLDGDKSTVWAEGVSGYGKGEYIILDLDSTYTIKQVKIVNGLINAYNGYYNNNRPKTLELSFSDGSSQTIYLKDDRTKFQTFNIHGNVQSSYVKITIGSVYYGSKYDDTCIAEVRVLGY